MVCLHPDFRFAGHVAPSPLVLHVFRLNVRDRHRLDLRPVFDGQREMLVRGKHKH